MYQAPSTRKPVVAEHWVPSEPDLANESQLDSLKEMPPMSKAPLGQAAQVAPRPNLAAKPIPTIAPLQERDIDADLAGIKGYESQYGKNADAVAGLKAKANDPTQKAQSSTLRKVLGVAGGVSAGLFTGNPLAGIGAYKAIEGAPERSRQKGIENEVKSLEARNAAFKEQAGMNKTGLDFIEGRMGQKVQARGQDVTEQGHAVTLAGQESVASNAALGAGKETIKVKMDDGRSQEMQFNVATRRYDIPVGVPTLDNDVAIPVTPEMATEFPELAGVKAISQESYTKLKGKADGNDPNMQDDYYDLKDGSRIMAGYKPNTGQYMARINGVLTDVTDKIKGPNRPPSAGVQMLTLTNTGAMPDDIRDAFNRTSMNLVPSRRYQIGQTIDDQLRRGDVNAAKATIKQASIESEPTAVQAQITGRRELMAQSQAIRQAMQEIPTGLIAGTVEKTIQKLGATGDPKYAQLMTRLKSLTQTYRKAMTGAQFSLPEAKEYASVLPSDTNNVELNTAIMDGLAGAIKTADTTFWNAKFSRPGWGDFEDVGFGPKPNLSGNGPTGAPAAGMVPMILNGREIQVHPSRIKEAEADGAKRK